MRPKPDEEHEIHLYRGFWKDLYKAIMIGLCTILWLIVTVQTIRWMVIQL